MQNDNKTEKITIEERINQINKNNAYVDYIRPETEKEPDNELLEIINRMNKKKEIEELLNDSRKVMKEVEERLDTHLSVEDDLEKGFKAIIKAYEAVKTEEDYVKLKIALEKDIIDEEEFTLIHNYTKAWQTKKRKLAKYPLPVVGTSKIDGSNVGKKNVRSKKVFYNRLEVAQWVKEYA